MPFDLDVCDSDWRRYCPRPEMLMTETELPEYVTPAQVGRACDMSRRKAKNLLRAVDIAECNDETGRWYVRTALLRERLPDVFDRVRRSLAVAPENFLAE